MTPRFLIMLIIATLLAGGAALIANHWILSQSDNKPAVVENNPEKALAYVAIADIHSDTHLDNNLFKLQSFDKNTIPPQAVTEEDTQKVPNTITGKIAQTNIYAGAILLKPQINERTSDLSTRIMPGMTAISVRVDDVTGVAGFIQPKDETDIIATHKNGGLYVLLRKVKVVAIDQISSGDQAKPVVVRALTLEVSPEDAVKLVEAARITPLQFALRNPMDMDTTISSTENNEIDTMPYQTEKQFQSQPSIKILHWGSHAFEQCHLNGLCEPAGS